MADIQIEVRSPFQRMILDTLWQFDTMEQCLRFRDSLPNQPQRDICTAMILMLAYEWIDTQVQTDQDCDQARQILAKF